MQICVFIKKNTYVFGVKNRKKIERSGLFSYLRILQNPIFMKPKRIVFNLLILLTPIFGLGQVVNIESKRIVTDTTGWSGGLGLNSSFIQNKKSLFSFGSKAHVQWKSTRKNLFLLVGEYGLTKGNTNVFQDYGFGHFRFTRKLNDRFAVETFAQAQYNKVNSLNFRGLLGIGPRYEVVSNSTLKVFLATLFMLERDVAVDGTFFEGGRWSTYVSFTYTPNAFFQVVNTTYYQPSAYEFLDYRVSGEAKLLWKIRNNLKFVTSYYYSYDEYPPEGAPKRNIRLNNGIKFSF